MKSTYWGEHGYEYVYALSAAIEAYTKRVEGLNKGAFTYSGIDLRFAVERDLYFRYVGSPLLVSLYNALQFGCVAERYLARDALEYFLAREMVEKIEIRFAGRLRYRRNVFRKFLQGGLRIVNRVRSASAISPDFAGRIAAYLTHPKFSSLFAPILAEFGADTVYIRPPGCVNETLPPAQVPVVDLVSVRWQKQGLARGSQLHLFPRVLSLCSTLVKTFSASKPHCVLIPEGNAPDCEVVNRVCRHLGVPVICIQNGWAPYIHNGFRNMSFTKMLVWGGQFARLLKPYNPEQNFVVTGSHLVSHKSVPADDAGEKGVVFFLQAPDQLISLRCWDNVLHLISWTAQKFPHVAVYVREHPQHRLSEKEISQLAFFPNVTLKAPQDCSLDRLLESSFISLSVHSSTILESIAAGVFPLIYNDTPMPHYFPDVHAAKAGIEVKTLEAAKELLAALITDPRSIDGYRTSMRGFAKDYFHSDRKDALKMIIREIKGAIPPAYSHRS